MGEPIELVAATDQTADLGLAESHLRNLDFRRRLGRPRRLLPPATAALSLSGSLPRPLRRSLGRRGLRRDVGRRTQTGRNRSGGVKEIASCVGHFSYLYTCLIPYTTIIVAIAGAGR